MGHRNNMRITETLNTGADSCTLSPMRKFFSLASFPALLCRQRILSDSQMSRAERNKKLAKTKIPFVKKYFIFYGR